jgi:hypothetical protein
MITCLLSMSTNLHRVLTADEHLTDRQLLPKEWTANRIKSLIFREGPRMSTVSSKEGQNLNTL